MFNLSKEDIKTIVELFISWNGEKDPIDTANIPSAVNYIHDCVGNKETIVQTKSIQERAHNYCITNYDTIGDMHMSDGIEKTYIDAYNDVIHRVDALLEYTLPNIEYITNLSAFRQDKKGYIQSFIKELKGKTDAS